MLPYSGQASDRSYRTLDLGRCYAPWLYLLILKSSFGMEDYVNTHAASTYNYVCVPFHQQSLGKYDVSLTIKNGSEMFEDPCPPAVGTLPWSEGFS